MVNLPIDKEVPETTVEEPNIEDESVNEQFSTLDILWNHAFRELEEFIKLAEYRDDVFLQEARYFAEIIKRNQENIKSAREQFNNEIANWERVAREELLMATTILQHFFPKRSYEINQQIDRIQKRTISILGSPFKMAANQQMMEKYLEMLDRYISFRKNSRKQYIKTISGAARLIYKGQKELVNLFTGQLNTLIFPLNRYMEKEEEVTKK